MSDDLDKYSDEDLTARERKELRRLLEQDKFQRWLRHTTRNLALWITSVVTAIIIFRDFLKGVAKHLVE